MAVETGRRLEGRVAIVTGAGRGIGAATARLFAAHGARLVVNDIDGEALEQVRETLPDHARAVAGDCADPAVAAALVVAALHHHGGVDLLVNNAGTTADGAFHAMDDAAWDRVHHANFETALATTRAIAPILRDRAMAELAEMGRVAWQRKITNTAATAYLTGNPGQANVAAAAGAVIGLTRTLARELGSFGVNVNCVAPGFVDTRLTRAETADDPGGVAEPIRQMTKAMTALGRHGTPSDIAGVHLFLASADADFVTGVTIPVAGGLLGTSL